MEPKAKILEIGPYPPPLAGWAIRIKFVREQLERMGHTCDVLNIGMNRRTPSNEYTAVYGAFDYAAKVVRYAARGYTFHVHVNDDFVGLLLGAFACIVSCLFLRRPVVSFHAGVSQSRFPRERSGWMLFVFVLVFKLPRVIICDNQAVKEKIREYGVSAAKIVPIQTFGSNYVDGSDTRLSGLLEDFIGRHAKVVSTYILFRQGFYVDTLLAAIPSILGSSQGVGLVVVSALEDCEKPIRLDAESVLNGERLRDHVLFANDLSHDAFLALLRRSSLFLRTPTSDGECASVLESLSLGTPVVAAENGNRPPSVVTYPAADAQAMYRTVRDVLENVENYRAKVITPPLRDTVREEAELLTRCSLGILHHTDEHRQTVESHQYFVATPSQLSERP